MKNLAVITGVFCLFGLPLLAAEPTDKGEQEFLQGWDLLKQNQYGESRKLFETALQKNPGSSLGHFYLAESCRGLKDWRCAEEHYETSLDLDEKMKFAELARQRLKKSKTWRMIQESKEVIEDPSAPPDKLYQASETLSIAKKIGLDDEQNALYEQLNDKLNSKKQAAASSAEKQKTLAAFRKMEGRWRFVDGNAVYRAVILDNGSLEMIIEQPGPKQQAVGLRSGDKYLFNFKIVNSDHVYSYGHSRELIRGYKTDTRANFTNGAELYAMGYKQNVYFFEKDNSCGAIRGVKPGRMVLAYIPPLDTIRLLPVDSIKRFSGCQVELDPMDTIENHYTTGWLEEMVRVR
jgi:hypothetical protein